MQTTGPTRCCCQRTHPSAPPPHTHACRLAEPPLQQLVPQLTTAQEGAAALLIQVKADTQQGLSEAISRAQDVLRGSGAVFGGQPDKPLEVESYPFSNDKRVCVLVAGGRGGSNDKCVCVGAPGRGGGGGG
jgi:hypothetical protein